MSQMVQVIPLFGFAFDLNWPGLIFADGASAIETLRWLFDFIVHLDDKLKELIRDYGFWTHLILFGVIFCETGLVVTPFLPGDSLLFAAGAFAADRTLLIEWLIPLLILAAILGDTVNYWIGKWVGARAFSGSIPFLKKEHLDKTHAYFEKYGGKTIIIARYIPIVRTFAPFVAGVGAMNYRHFFIYNVIGGVVWVLSFLLPGYQFGKYEFVQKNFKLLFLAIIAISILPMVWEWWHLRSSKASAAEPVAEPSKFDA